MKRTALALAAAAIFFSPVHAQEADGAGTNNWLVNCSNQLLPSQMRCEMSQSIVSQQTSQRVGSMRIFRADESDVLEIIVPFGVNVADGITLSVDGNAIATLPFQSANSNGLYTSIELSGEVAAAFKQGGKVLAGVRNSFGQGFEIEFVLTGFTVAHGVYEKAMAE